MTRNPSYGSLPPEKPTCPNCGNIIALTCDTCLQCGFSQFLIRGTGVSKVACTACEGNGKKEWYAYSSGDYCDNCKGRGYTLSYSYDQIDLRTNKVTESFNASDAGDFYPHGNPGLGISAVEPIHRGIIREPFSFWNLSHSVFEFVVYIIGLCYYAWLIFIWSAILYLVYQVFQLLFS